MSTTRNPSVEPLLEIADHKAAVNTIEDLTTRLHTMPLGRSTSKKKMAESVEATSWVQPTFQKDAPSEVHVRLIYVEACKTAGIYIDGKFSYMVYEPNAEFFQLARQRRLPLYRIGVSQRGGKNRRSSRGGDQFSLPPEGGTVA